MRKNVLSFSYVGHSTSQSETDDEEDEQEDAIDDENDVNNCSIWKVLHVDFDRGNDDGKLASRERHS